MTGTWVCPRCYRDDRTPVRLVIARMDEPLNHTQATVCLRCADVLWHRLRKVVGPLVRDPKVRATPAGSEESIPGGDDAEETGQNARALRALPAR